MGLFGNHSGNQKTAARSIKISQNNAAPAVNIPVSLQKQYEAVKVSLGKKQLTGITAQVVLVLDHSGSMAGNYSNGTVQQIVERFLAFALNVDMDGTVPVVPFDSRVRSTVNVTSTNYSGVVDRQIFNYASMGSTNLTDALKEVRKMAEETMDPLFVAIVTDGEPDDSSSATEVVVDLARYPVFIKFIAVQPVRYLDTLDDMGDDKRLLDNVDSKYYPNISNVTDEQFADDMADEWDSWMAAAKQAGILE